MDETISQAVETALETVQASGMDSEVISELQAINANIANINTWVMYAVWFVMVLFCGIVAWGIWHFIILRSLRRYIQFHM